MLLPTPKLIHLQPGVCKKQMAQQSYTETIMNIFREKLGCKWNIIKIDTFSFMNPAKDLRQKTRMKSCAHSYVRERDEWFIVLQRNTCDSSKFSLPGPSKVKCLRLIMPTAFRTNFKPLQCQCQCLLWGRRRNIRQGHRGCNIACGFPWIAQAVTEPDLRWSC